MGAAETPSFWVRFIGLPFWLRLWRDAAELGAGAILLPLCLWALLAAWVGGMQVAHAARSAIYDFATYYQENADPLLLENDRFQLQGERILRIDDPDDDSLILIDPEETVPDEEVAGRERSVVVRADKVVFRQPRQSREWTASEVAELFGKRVVFDADWIRRAADDWVYPSVLVGYPLAASALEVIACGIYSLAVGLLLFLLRGQWLGLDYPACASVALATSAFTIVADAVLVALGVQLPVPGFALWPLVMTGLGLAALSESRPEDVPRA